MATIQLLGSTGSPYARKPRVFLLENGVPHEWLEVATPVWAEVHGELRWTWRMADDKSVDIHNPLGKIPVLLHRGQAWFDSRVIGDYLEQLVGCAEPAPCSREALRVLGVEGLSDSVCDVLGALNGRRGRTPELADVARDEFEAGLSIGWLLQQLEDELRKAPPYFPRRGSLSRHVIAVNVALAYLDFRLPQLSWRATHPQLRELHARCADRPSIYATAFPSPP